MSSSSSSSSAAASFPNNQEDGFSTPARKTVKVNYLKPRRANATVDLTLSSDGEDCDTDEESEDSDAGDTLGELVCPGCHTTFEVCLK
jgi:hypothetical protein